MKDFPITGDISAVLIGSVDMVSFKTPNCSCLTEKDKQNVYEPAEDTFLLLDALQNDYQLINEGRPGIVVEVGCGSGVVSSFVSQILDSPALVMCTDVNPRATELTRRLSIANGHSVEPILADLVACFEPRLENQIDLLVFNPPYVVTPSEEVGAADISASWAGGKDGREVLDRLLPKLSQLLSPIGLFYLVAIKENRIDNIMAQLLEQGLIGTVVMERRSGPEHLMIIRATRQ